MNIIYISSNKMAGADDIYADYKVIAAPVYKAGSKEPLITWNHLRIRGPREFKNARDAGYYYLGLSPYHPRHATHDDAKLTAERKHSSLKYCGGKSYIIASIIYGMCYPIGYTNPFGYTSLGTPQECLGVGKVLGGGFGFGGGGDEDGGGRRGRRSGGRGSGRGRRRSGRGGGARDGRRRGREEKDEKDEKDENDENENDAGDRESDNDEEEEEKEPVRSRSNSSDRVLRPRPASSSLMIGISGARS